MLFHISGLLNWSSARLPSFNHSVCKSILYFIIGLNVPTYPFSIYICDQRRYFDDCFIFCKRKEPSIEALNSPDTMFSLSQSTCWCVPFICAADNSTIRHISYFPCLLFLKSPSKSPHINALITTHYQRLSS